MAREVPAICFACKGEHLAHPVTDSEAEAIAAEDPQSFADYYRMTQHANAQGQPCDGSYRPPTALVGEDTDSYPFAGPRYRNDSRADEVTLYGHRAWE